MSKNYEKVKRFYDRELWSEARVKNAVKARWITPAEYELIIGEKYTEED